jgi:L-ascorbate metabolism protein UlaG (beta-lactamase superfamily)
MEITLIGHSCFRIKGKEVTLVTDPFDNSLGYSMGEPTAAIVTSSHNHPGHHNVASVLGGPKVISRPGEYEIGGVFVTGIRTFHDADQGVNRGKNITYLIKMDDIRLCHLGDLGHLLSPSQIEDLGSIDVLFVPVGGVSTINGKMAAEIVKLLNPRIIIPMHYKTEVVTWLESADNFLKEIGLSDITSQPKLSIVRSSLPPESRVIVLDHLGR